MRLFLFLLILSTSPAFASGLLTMGGDEASARLRLDQSWDQFCDFPEGVTGFRFQAQVTAGGYMRNPQVVLMPDGTSNRPLEFCIDAQIKPTQPLKATGEVGEIHYTYKVPIEEPEGEPLQPSGPMVTTITIVPNGPVTIVQTPFNERDKSPP